MAIVSYERFQVDKDNIWKSYYQSATPHSLHAGPEAI